MWNGHSQFSSGLIHYRGPAGDNVVHAHAALQLVTSGGVIEFGEGQTKGAPFYIRPSVPHRLLPAPDVDLFLIEPASRLGQTLLVDLSGDPVGPLSDDDLQTLLGFESKLETYIPDALAVALNYLSGEDALQRSVADAATEAGISTSHLRSLASDTLGVPLSRWRLWQSLQLALTHLANGDRIADAAFAAGFSDQAHLTRSMKSTLGLTPGAVQMVKSAN